MFKKRNHDLLHLILLVFIFLVGSFSFPGLKHAYAEKNKYGLNDEDEVVIYFEDFERKTEDGLPLGWWVEGGEKVFVENGHLRMMADPDIKNKSKNVCTAWFNKEFSGDLKVEFDAHVNSSSKNANNINFFFLYSDPSGTPLYDSRKLRYAARYGYYHNFNGYIFTFLNDFRNKMKGDPARMRMRRCPGFKLMTEVYSYHCKKNVTYHVCISKKKNELSLSVDNKIYLQASDRYAFKKGLIGLRTFQTDLWWDNIRVTQIH